MKTPREILLGKYELEESSLDAIRRRALEHLESTRHSSEPATRQWPSLGEILLGFRWHLASLTAAWTAIVLLWVTSAPTNSNDIKQALPLTKQETAIARENRRMLHELLNTGNSPVISATMPSRSSRRSETQLRFANV